MNKRKKRAIGSAGIMDIIRREKRNLLPLMGGWVCVMGNSRAPRGMRIQGNIHELGVQHLDIYYAYDEECPWALKLDDENRALWNIRADDSEIIDHLLETNWIDEDQITWMTLNTPASQLIRMWHGEVRLFSDSLIKDLLKENYVQMIPFGTYSKKESPVWDEVTRDMIGSLQLDGLSYQEAQAELITGGVEFERDPMLPPYFYRPVGEYRDRFCEE